MSLICVADIEGSNGGETHCSDVLFEGSGSNGEHEEHEEQPGTGEPGSVVSFWTLRFAWASLCCESIDTKSLISNLNVLASIGKGKCMRIFFENSIFVYGDKVKEIENNPPKY
jgi:hypothetical protein